MAVTGMANLAVKVADLEGACAWYEAAGATVTDPVAWENGRRADVQLGVLSLTLFTKAIYEDACTLPDEGFLHPALFVDDLNAELARHQVLWGPRTVSGTFGSDGRLGIIVRCRCEALARCSHAGASEVRTG